MKILVNYCLRILDSIALKELKSINVWGTVCVVGDMLLKTVAAGAIAGFDNRVSASQ